MTISWLSGRSRSKFFNLLCRTPRRRITELADGFDMQAECNGADLRVNEQIVLRRTPIASRLQNNLPRQRAGPANRAFLLQPMRRGGVRQRQNAVDVGSQLSLDQPV